MSLFLELQQQFLRHLHALLPSFGTGPPHPFQRLLGQRDAGDFVVQETGVAVSLQRQHADQHRHRKLAITFFIERQEVTPQLRVIDGLGHGKVRAAAHLLVEAVHLLPQIGPRRVARHRNRKASLLPHLAPGDIQPLVKGVDDAHQPNAVHVIDRAAVAHVADAGRVARQRQDIPHPQGACADQVGL